MLKQRLITALILIPIIVIGVLHAPTILFSYIAAIFIVVGAWEWSGLAEFTHMAHKLIYILLTVAIMGISYVLYETPLATAIVIAGVAWWLCALVLIMVFQKNVVTIPLTQVLKAVIGILILVPAWMSFVILHASHNGPRLVLFLLILIWLADSAAFFVGRQFGKRRLANKISPGKSWEGAFAALFASLLLGLGYSILTGQQDVLVGLLILCIMTVIFSIFGDLTESMFKRIVDIKDSGKILPGHGGVLDRIDSLTAAAPIYLTGLWLLEGMR